MEYEQEKPQGFMNWLQESVTLKLMFIGLLVLLLLIPSSMIENLIGERQIRHDEMEKDVSDKWSASQLIQGPVLVIPYKRQYNNRDTNNKLIMKEVTENLYLLPEHLHIKANVISDILHRGMYETVVYNTHVKVWGDFKAELAKLSLTPGQLLLSQAKLTFSISDLKGLKTNPLIKLGTQTQQAEPVFDAKGLFEKGLQAGINLPVLPDSALPFDFDLDLKGSQELRFLHTGKTTDVEVTGNWPAPSFSGRYLPDYRKIDEKGFTAKWRMLYFNRPFAQQWTANDTLLNNMQTHQDAVFGVRLKVPVDQYQKTMRTSKYGILIILLTFISLFLTELISKNKIHVFNYILIGAAMIIYYTLLLSFSEQIGYNLAYLIASVATITLIATFIASLLKNKLAAILFAVILTVFYVFIFVIIQLEDLALLIGSIALFVIVAALMYCSRKINWNKP
ncbi:cell envelope integrity protein CreD [Mucilaginibacter sp. UR6-11]|uniref:cell envelope integrity protein CreD n=1 Tax=Mucilaginibacter sp. UR6-11 TaxID=1435644 RepID=UPI001E413526|nr:cell envelope integrity protein CreD [Mucilaginibacter sp. UR6-11]MCC8426912.1 cell envelope integrity protein CreD [Mucilaginibacter sp. UR6-11]